MRCLGVKALLLDPPDERQARARTLFRENLKKKARFPDIALSHVFIDIIMSGKRSRSSLALFSLFVFLGVPWRCAGIILELFQVLLVVS